MAGESKQIYQLTSGTFNGSSLVPFEVPNTDPSSSAERPYITRKTTGDEVSEFVAKTQEFETDLETTDKHIIGAINEIQNGTTYNVGDSFSASVYKHCAGRTVNVGNAVLCFYPTAKPIASNVQAASMNLTQGICYTATGGIALKAGVYQGTITDGGIYFNITLNSSFSDGGRNATVEFQNRTITFN